METIKQYLIPFVISNLLFGFSVIGAIKKPIWTRVFLAVVFLWAAWTNGRLALSTPEIYQEYGKLTPIPIYQEFIAGFFSKHIQLIVMFVAISQFLICIGLILRNSLTKWACIAGALFGLAIAPLGIGSAFPATVLMSISFIILARTYEHDYLWKWTQYRFPASHRT